jgi:hypothetical protein
VRTYLHVAFAFDGEPRVKDFEPVFNKSRDWMRYAPNCWIVYTSRPPQFWAEKVQPLMKRGESVLVVEIDPKKRQGLLPKWAWEWLKKARD